MTVSHYPRNLPILVLKTRPSYNEPTVYRHPHLEASIFVLSTLLHCANVLESSWPSCFLLIYFSPASWYSLKVNFGGIWVAQLVKCLSLAQVMISWFLGSSPISGSMLAQSLEPTSDSVSLSLCPFHVLVLSLSLFQ